MQLTKDLSAVADQFGGSAPPEVITAIETGMSLTQSDISPLEVGEQVPDFELNNATGQPVRLTDLLTHGPVVVSFYRGGWCPFCNLELRALQEALPEFKALGASLVAISPEVPDSSLSTQEKNALDFHVLSDVGSTVSGLFGLSFVLDEDTKGVYEGFGLDLPTLNGAGTWELVVPGTYVIDPQGTVTAAFVDTDYRRRTEPAAILDVLANLTGSPS